MRIVSWNIRAGGGVRAQEIAGQLKDWMPDIVVLEEFRGTNPSREIAQSLRQYGLEYQRITIDPSRPTVNSLLVASRWPLRTVRLKRAPIDPARWLHVNIASHQPMAILAVHIPNRVTGRKYPFMDAAINVIQKWSGPPGILIGDTNSGRIGMDEETQTFTAYEDQWLVKIAALGWQDAFRRLHSQKRDFTWYSPNGNNGFRLDQAFLHPDLTGKLKTMVHSWGGYRGARRDSLSDHAALVLDLDFTAN